MPQPKKHASPAARQAARTGEQARRIEIVSKGLPSLPAISTLPGWPRWNASLRVAQDLIVRTQTEMEQYFDNRSEIWQESERGEEHQNTSDLLQAVLDEMCDLMLI